MNRIVVERRVGDDGMLQLNLPLGTDEAGHEVRVTIENVGKQNKATPEEWRAGILATAGGWLGEFERPSLSQPEEREPLL